MADIEMKGFKEVCEKYPQYADRIANAFTTVLADDERDIEAELYGCEIEEEDIFKIVDSVMEVKFGAHPDLPSRNFDEKSRDDFDDLMDKWDAFAHPVKQPGDW